MFIKKIYEPERAIGARRGRSIPNRTQEKTLTTSIAVHLCVPPCLRACCVCVCAAIGVRAVTLVRVRAAIVRTCHLVRWCVPPPYACVPHSC